MTEKNDVSESGPPLQPEQRLGHYRLLERLGRGGMGEVWRAHDGRLKRHVALKVLPPELADHPRRLARFQREAEALAALNHPRIVTIFSVEDDGGEVFLTMELVEGETLGSVVRRGPVPIPRCLELAAQLADALAEAHDQGVVHRDLKPGNLMIDRHGRLKVLDFGLAKIFEESSSSGEPEAEPGGTVPFTRAGFVLGTVEYMSPEQAQGQAVDFRSDQFSFGLVLYELLTGKNPVRRESPVRTMVAITEEPLWPVAEIRPEIPLPLAWIVDRCLAKQPEDRFASTRDLLLDLRQVREAWQDLGTAPARRVRGLSTTAKSSRWKGAIGVGLLAAAFAGFALWPRGASSEGADLRQARLVPVATETAIESSPAWDPRGRTLAYLREVDGIDQVFTRSLDAPLPTQVTQAPDDCRHPIWSQDGTRLYFISGHENTPALWRVGAAGGVPEIIAESVITAALSADGGTLAMLRNEATDTTYYSLWTSGPDGHDLERFVTPPLDDVRSWDGHLGFSPDGTTLAMWIARWDLTSELWLIPLDGGSPRSVLPELSGLPHPRPFSWLPDSRHIVFAEKSRSVRGADLWIADLERGEATPLMVSTSIESHPAVSPSGDRVALSVFEEHYDIVEIPLDGGPMRTVLATHVNELHPVFDPDGTSLAYVTDRSGQDEIWIERPGEDWKRPLVGAGSFPAEDPYLMDEPAFSPDGHRIAYQTWRAGEFAIWISPVAGGPPVRLGGDSRPQGAPEWSPDGTWIAYMYSEGPVLGLAKARVGSSEVVDLQRDLAYVPPRWSPDGQWILVQSPDHLLLVAQDGSETREISDARWRLFGWDGQDRIIGVRLERDRRVIVSAIDPAGTGETVLNSLPPIPRPAIFSSRPVRGLALARGGESIITSIPRVTADIWWLEGVKWPGTQ